jgi:hypothetical protein
MVVHMSAERLHLSIIFLSLIHESAVINSASSDLHVSTCHQSSCSPYMQQCFDSPYNCSWCAPVCLRLWHIYAAVACHALDTRLSAVSCLLQYMLLKACVVHCSFFIRYSWRSPSKSCCINLSFQLIVIFTTLIKSAHLSRCHSPQLGLAP